ncbi:MAG: RIO1 family regulatory kinase/ATPase [Planctomycetota bacterium]
MTRGNVEQYVIREFGSPKWCDARVKLVERDGDRAVFKDVRDRHPLVRFTFGRYLIGREFRIYERLRGLAGVPRACKRIDRDGFLVEYVDGVAPTRKKLRRGLDMDEAYYRRCRELIARLHARGVVHLDLRSAKNFLLVGDDRPYIVDFASALYIPRWVPFQRRLIRLLGSFDRAGLLKLKQKLAPDQMTDDERRRLARFERTRAVLFPHAPLLRALRRRRRRKKKAGRRDADGRT